MPINPIRIRFYIRNIGYKLKHVGGDTVLHRKLTADEGFGEGFGQRLFKAQLHSTDLSSCYNDRMQCEGVDCNDEDNAL